MLKVVARFESYDVAIEYSVPTRLGSLSGYTPKWTAKQFDKRYGGGIWLFNGCRSDGTPIEIKAGETLRVSNPSVSMEYFLGWRGDVTEKLMLGAPASVSRPCSARTGQRRRRRRIPATTRSRSRSRL